VGTGVAFKKSLLESNAAASENRLVALLLDNRKYFGLNY